MPKATDSIDTGTIFASPTALNHIKNQIMTVKVLVEHLDKDNFRLANGKSADTLNPKELLLYATACCAGKTVIAILDKQRIVPEKFEIAMYGELDTDEVTAQSTFKSFRIIYDIVCPPNDDEHKVQQTVKSADEKYCGTLKMMRRIAPVTSEIKIGAAVKAW